MDSLIALCFSDFIKG